MGWLPWPCPAVFPELLMSVTFAKMHKALISAWLTFTSRNPSVKPAHNRGKLQNQNRPIHVLWKRNYKHAYAHTYSQRMKTPNPFSIILSTVRFQAFTFLFLWSREVPVSTKGCVNPVLKFAHSTFRTALTEIGGENGNYVCSGNC